MIIHLYAQCWNDERMLPFFFRHYDSLVDRYFIYDDKSSDATWSILRSHPKVDARRFVRSEPDSFVLSERAFSNECWKESRGQADWVIVTDLDEHLFHPEWHQYLLRCISEEISLIPALGFQMISKRSPLPGEFLCREYTIGAPWDQLMKSSILNPNAIVEMDFAPGRHMAEPLGCVRVPRIDEMLLLHYKYMGFNETWLRHQQLRQGLRSYDVVQGWGHKYGWSAAELEADWSAVSDRSIDITTILDNPSSHYPIEAWWRRFSDSSS
jgi:hypothetical protein